MENLVRFGVAVPESLLREFDYWIARQGIPNRSETLRQLIRDFVARGSWELGEGNVYGTVTISYDHHARDTTSELTDLQHDFGDIIVCTTHVHIDHDHCMEVIMLKGQALRVRSFLDDISGMKSINNISPVIKTAL